MCVSQRQSFFLSRIKITKKIEIVRRIELGRGFCSFLKKRTFTIWLQIDTHTSRFIDSDINLRALINRSKSLIDLWIQNNIFS